MGALSVVFGLSPIPDITTDIGSKDEHHVGDRSTRT